DVQRALAELAAFARNIKTVEDLAETRFRRWQRDVALGATLVAFGLAILVGFLGSAAVRRAAARFRAHVTELEQGNFAGRVVSVPGDDLAPVAAV
ncbi:hypothetical protein, partial [Enterococcus faecium]|uniref:hypothetical protein n=1 Tax=Enterococcus faecium TaxID=1352 RepID=UPI0039BE5336